MEHIEASSFLQVKLRAPHIGRCSRSIASYYKWEQAKLSNVIRKGVNSDGNRIYNLADF